MYNGHADVTALIDNTGVIATYYYDAFGNIQENTGNANNPFKYAGYQYDDEIGSYYLNSRYYDPAIARFLSEDTHTGSADDPLSLNLYTYCHNEPLMYSDPTGHSEFGSDDSSNNPFNTLIKPNLLNLDDDDDFTDIPKEESDSGSSGGQRKKNSDDINSNSSTSKEYTAQKGDCLSALADKFHTTQQAIIGLSTAN